MADMDLDGDLDIVINNLRGSAYLFENQLCGKGNGVEVALSWPKSGNTHAIGSKVILETEMGAMSRDVRASGGYLSGDSSTIHFGVPEGLEILEINIKWPDGKLSNISGLEVQSLIKVTRK